MFVYLFLSVDDVVILFHFIYVGGGGGGGGVGITVVVFFCLFVYCCWFGLFCLFFVVLGFWGFLVCVCVCVIYWVCTEFKTHL